MKKNIDAKEICMIKRLMNLLSKGNEEETYFFSTRSVWLELGAPKSLVNQKFQEYFGDEVYSIANRDDASELLDNVIKGIQEKLYKRITEQDTRHFVSDLIAMFDAVFTFYMNQKEARAKLKEVGVTDGAAYETFETNKQICRNIIDSSNIWFENAVLHQVLTEKTFDAKYELDFDLLLEVYIYGLASVNYSLLHIGRLKGLGSSEFYYGLDVNPKEDIPIKAVREHPVIYFNPILGGNQNGLVDNTEFKDMDSSAIGLSFTEKYGYSFLRHTAILHVSEDALTKRKMTNKQFANHIDSLGVDGINGNAVSRHLVLSKENVRRHLKENESYIWTIGTNEHRVELKPFLKMGKNDVFTSKCLINQSKTVWASYCLNGGMIYTSSIKDKLQIAFESRNKVLSDRLVSSLREKLRQRYNGDFDEIEVSYTSIWGKRKINYGDFDNVFFCKDTNELFLIEAKFISDALNSSGIVSDYDKMFKEKGYYSKCRRRYDLVISEPDKLKQFIGATGKINVHFLFVTSKPLEIELQDEDGIVTFIGLESFENYLDGKFIAEEGDEIVRPTYSL